ncbi:MAG: EutP/PduV family microcompartment system protein [Actinomycetia bacterium]|nr:EutP/PduV family microcompartment system protein [Actinomycetes bacterium]
MARLAGPAGTARLMLVGSVGCGKTTLAQRLRDQRLARVKTQTTQYLDTLIDTPGEYLRHGHLRRALQQAEPGADLVALLQSASEGQETIPPGFATFFTKPVIGIITKIDIADAERRRAARERLHRAGAREIIAVSAWTGEGLAELSARLAR